MQYWQPTKSLKKRGWARQYTRGDSRYTLHDNRYTHRNSWYTHNSRNIVNVIIKLKND